MHIANSLQSPASICLMRVYRQPVFYLRSRVSVFGRFRNTFFFKFLTFLKNLSRSDPISQCQRESRCQSFIRTGIFLLSWTKAINDFPGKKIMEGEANESSSLMFQDPQVLQPNGRSSSSPWSHQSQPRDNNDERFLFLSFFSSFLFSFPTLLPNHINVRRSVSPTLVYYWFLIPREP